MPARRYCKKCNAVFDTDKCPGGHANFMYTSKIPPELAMVAPVPETPRVPDVSSPRPALPELPVSRVGDLIEINEPAPAPVPAATPAPSPPSAAVKAVAQHDFGAQDPATQLDLSQGETVLVVDRSHADWWRVQNEACFEGYVPSSYLKLKSAGVPSPVPAGKHVPPRQTSDLIVLVCILTQVGRCW